MRSVLIQLIQPDTTEESTRYFTFQNEIPPQIEEIDALSLFMLTTLAFVTVTLVQTSNVVIYKMLIEYNDFKADVKNERMQERIPTPMKQEGDISQRPRQRMMF